jgi:hypothetical protein
MCFQCYSYTVIIKIKSGFIPIQLNLFDLYVLTIQLNRRLEPSATLDKKLIYSLISKFKTKYDNKPDNPTMSKDNPMLLMLIPLHPPIAKLITQTTDDAIVSAKKNLTLKNDFQLGVLLKNLKSDSQSKTNYN